MNLSVNLNADKETTSASMDFKMQKELEENNPISKKTNSSQCKRQASTICTPAAKKARVSFLKSPEPWQIKNIKIYNEEEMEKVAGNEKAYSKFWNEQAKELSVKHPKKSKQEIISTNLTGTKFDDSNRRRKEFITKTGSKSRNH